jgi:hypothetical protein
VVGRGKIGFYFFESFIIISGKHKKLSLKHRILDNMNKSSAPPIHPAKLLIKQKGIGMKVRRIHKPPIQQSDVSIFSIFELIFEMV